MDERWVDIDGTRLFVRSWGEAGGKSLLYWHGVSLTSRASLTLSPVGRNSPPLERDAYHPHALVDLVPPLLDALGLEHGPFMGFSWGGDVGLHLAARHPERLTALVLLDAGYKDPPFDPSQSFEAYLAENEQFWEEACQPS